MSSKAWLVVALLVGTREVRAQARAELQGRLARAEHLQDSLRTVDSAAAQRAFARAEVGRSGPVRLLLHAGGGPADAVASTVWDAYRRFGGFTDTAISRFVLAEEGVAERGQRLDNRITVTFGRPGGLTGDDPRFVSSMADNAIWSLSGALLDGLVMGPWLEHHLDPRLAAETEKHLAGLDLKEGRWRSTRGCLAGVAAECVVYLGIEEHPDLRTRYPVADIRRVIGSYASVPSRQHQECVNGSDQACERAWADPGGPPASWATRWSFVAFVRERYGREAVARVLSDTAASVGLSFRRVTGRSFEDLAREWRDWLLPATERWPVAAGMLQAGVSLTTALLLLGMAARSGRWRE